MRRSLGGYLIPALVLSVLSATALGQVVVLGILEDNHGWYAGEPNFRAVRVVFQRVGLEWKPFPSDCPDQQCLNSVAAKYPHEMKWTVTFDGKNVGQITSYTPNEFKWYAAVGQQEIADTGHVPTIGKRSSEFGGYAERTVYRPLVANSQPYFKDPEEWKPTQPSPDLVSQLQRAFRKQFPHLCRLGGPNSSEMNPFPYRNEEVKVVKTYRSNTGWALSRLHLEAVDCADVEAGFDIDDPWFVVSPVQSVKYLDSGIWLVDAGDYDNDGRSELVFSINRDNRGGYMLFYDDFKKRASFEFNYH
jgi:hypothetical protein